MCPIDNVKTGITSHSMGRKLNNQDPIRPIIVKHITIRGLVGERLAQVKRIKMYQNIFT